jgi:hypothetical protein
MNELLEETLPAEPVMKDITTEDNQKRSPQVLSRPLVKSIESPITNDSDTHELDLSVDPCLSASTTEQVPASPKRMQPEPSPEYQLYDPETIEPKGKRKQSTTRKDVNVFQDLVETRVSDGGFEESRGASAGTSGSGRVDWVQRWPINGRRAGTEALNAMMDRRKWPINGPRAGGAASGDTQERRMAVIRKLLDHRLGSRKHRAAQRVIAARKWTYPVRWAKMNKKRYPV